MSKRFTETEKWRDPWFRKLSPRQKCLWQYLCDCCDQAGVIELDLETASYFIGETVCREDFLQFSDRIKDIGCDKIWLKKFIKFQYGKLSRECKPHVPVFVSLEKHGINYTDAEQSGAFQNKVDASVREKIIERDGFTCVYTGECLLPDEIVIDHVIPRSAGGLNKPSNLVVTSNRLNAIKSDLSLNDFCLKAGLNIAIIRERLSKALAKPLKGFETLQEKEKEKDKDQDRKGVGNLNINPPSLESCMMAVGTIGMKQEDVEACFHYWTARGWKSGAGQPLQNLPSVLALWKSKAMKDSAPPPEIHDTRKSRFT